MNCGYFLPSAIEFTDNAARLVERLATFGKNAAKSFWSDLPANFVLGVGAIFLAGNLGDFPQKTDFRSPFSSLNNFGF